MRLLLALLLLAAPDPALTPGKTDPAITKAVVCSTRTRDRRHVTKAMRKEVLRRYGIRWARRGEYEADHLVSLCSGGSNELANLWPQAWGDARKKDKLEVALCRAVCRGEMDLAAAQKQLRNWGR